MLRESVSLQAHLKALKITPNRVYSYVLNGYAATLSQTQSERLVDRAADRRADLDGCHVSHGFSTTTPRPSHQLPVAVCVSRPCCTE